MQNETENSDKIEIYNNGVTPTTDLNDEKEKVDANIDENLEEKIDEKKIEANPDNSLLTSPDASMKLLIEDFSKNSQVLDENKHTILENETTLSKNTLEEKEFKMGTTKDLKGFWTSKQTASNTKFLESPKLPIQLPKGSDKSIIENVPEVKEGVVKSGDTPNEVSIESGYAKKLAHMFMQTPTKQNLSEGDNLKDVSNMGAGVKALMGKFIGNGEFKSVENISGSPEKPYNTPIASKVQTNSTEETKNGGIEVVAQGTTKNLIQKFVSNNNAQPIVKFADVRKILEAGKAFESGVFENTPERRDDVIKSDYIEDCNVIPANATRSAREKFAKLSQQTNGISSPTQVN